MQPTSFGVLICFSISLITSSCTKKGEAPLAQITTTSVTEITNQTAKGGGSILTDGGSPVIARGVCWSINPLPTINDNKSIDGGGTGTFISVIGGLDPNTKYHVRAYATTGNGTAYGLALEFTTQAFLKATLTTKAAIDISPVSASSGGDVSSDGGSSITERGICYSTSHNPTISDGKTIDGAGVGSFNSLLTGLKSNTTYFLRAYATNGAGTTYGNEVSFLTLTSLFTQGNGVSDVDGNSYSTIVLGTQEWIANNLRTSKYSNGDPISNQIDLVGWSGASTGAWCYYENNVAFNSAYGKLYNYYAVTDLRNLCPTGWHIPNETEWTTLSTFLGGAGVAGGKMKEVGLAHWIAPNIGADNTSGFSAIPGGNRRGGGNPLFEVMGSMGRYWSSTAIDNISAIGHDVVAGDVNIGTNQFAYTYGFSVRCVKN